MKGIISSFRSIATKAAGKLKDVFSQRSVSKGQNPVAKKIKSWFNFTKSRIKKGAAQQAPTLPFKTRVKEGGLKLLAKTNPQKAIVLAMQEKLSSAFIKDLISNSNIPFPTQRDIEKGNTDFFDVAIIQKDGAALTALAEKLASTKPENNKVDPGNTKIAADSIEDMTGDSTLKALKLGVSPDSQISVTDSITGKKFTGSALAYAAKKKNFQAIKYLILFGADKTSKGYEDAMELLSQTANDAKSDDAPIAKSVVKDIIAFSTPRNT